MPMRPVTCFRWMAPVIDPSSIICSISTMLNSVNSPFSLVLIVILPSCDLLENKRVFTLFSLLAHYNRCQFVSTSISKVCPRCYNHYRSIKDRVAIITGAGRGVGRATALRFAREGARVVLFIRTPAAVDEVASELTCEGYAVLPITGDVSHEGDVQALFQQVIHVYGRVDILVNCAGIVAVRPFVEMDTATWDRVIAVNLRGTFLCCREAFRIMAAQHSGVIVNLSSLSGVSG